MWEQAKALQEGAEIVVCTPVKKTAQMASSEKSETLKCQQRIFTEMFVCTGASDRPRQKEGHITAESHIPGV